jgi:hypothetical protein
MAWRIIGQYISEGLAAAFMFTLAGLGFILPDQTNMPRLNRILMILLLVHLHSSGLFSDENLHWVSSILVQQTLLSDGCRSLGSTWPVF